MFDALLVTCAAGAAVCLCSGWFLHAFLHRAEIRRLRCDESQRAREALNHLRELAALIAADVGMHSSRVRAVSDELAKSEHQSADMVVAAIAKLMGTAERMQQQLDSAEGKLQQQAGQLVSHATAARTDALTQLTNRRGFDEELTRCVRDYLWRKLPVSVLLVDVDHFKRINDVHGHLAGDEVLRAVADSLRQAFQEVGLAARYGGEEFAVILPGYSVKTAQELSQRAVTAVASTRIDYDDQAIAVTGSVGLAELPANGDLNCLLRRADEALYASKRAGRNCGHWHDGRAVHPLPRPNVETDGVSHVTLFPITGAVSGEAKPAPAAAAILGVSSRAAFQEDLSRRVAEARRVGTTCSLLLVKVDQFLQFAAEHDTRKTNLVLRATAQFLKGVMRDMDHVGRYDDDMFALLLPGTKLEYAVAAAERVRGGIQVCELPLRGVEGEVERGGRSGHGFFTVSIGVVEISENETPSYLLARAEQCLDAALLHGGDCTYADNGYGCEIVTPEPTAASAATGKTHQASDSLAFV